MHVMATEAYEQNLLWLLMDNDEVTLGNGITWRKMSNMEDDFRLRAIVPMTLLDQSDIAPHVMSLLRSLLGTMLSETTNNDACRVTITETSAHFEVHFPDDPQLANAEFGSYVVYDAHIDDYLT